MDRLMLRLSEAADLVGISRSMAYEMARRGEWPVVRIGQGRALRIPYAELKLWIDSRIEGGQERPFESGGDGRLAR